MQTNKIIPITNYKSGSIYADAIKHSDTKEADQFEKREISEGISILSEPTDVITREGTYVNFSAIVRCSKASYQWFNMFGYPIPHKNSSKLDFCPVKEEDFGFYRLRITDELTQRTELTRWTELGRNVTAETERREERPVLRQSPEGGQFQQGDTVRLTGYFDATTAYQWFKDGAKLEGCDGNVLLISNAYQANTGEYVLAAYNANHKETSGVAKVFIY